ncbi:hypothetical protein E5F05_12820 [Deinococcus metallilatus]|uniref:Uncharacterized protein n=1 Tax=Deinococcus metallilatus TaxID=1211322 RepID=A0AAJ5F6G0_9DEIO|nr:hypothetical protein [Deinococcus metallilatus]MBB5295079.1 hypothetical protein [Deinococcus metallilatus]QBY08741.1 hypothetical protein E5F05_12820 [Deinococcus metallilatus]RXJ10620.1 hypothetical protein ERJ73_11650 [Deinococcus metallilatus]TLK26591.1 hypothetical protein FCS05_11400 [Deinococcus metallilatus]GMA14851.1 hypothetical protein GCM10025871_11820 [Deinococcus metallilatus]
MKFMCECGSVIVDQTDGLPYRAYLLPDQDAFAFLDRLRTLLDGLVSPDEGRKGKATVQAMPLRNKLQREVNRLWAESFRDVYQCPECGRLHVESLDRQRLASFLPEDEDTPKTLLQSAASPE